MKKVISPEAFKRRMWKMKKIAEEENDLDRVHGTADDLLCEVLRDLGYEAGVKIFEEIPKFYS